MDHVMVHYLREYGSIGFQNGKYVPDEGMNLN